MWVIAIDEAGYGPKLGPLVVGASVWRRADERFDTKAASESIDSFGEDAFLPIATPVAVQDGNIRVNDSKQVFRSKSSGKDGGSLTTLHRIVSVAHHACGRSDADLARRIKTLVPRDHAAIAKVPWLAALTSEKRLKSLVEVQWTPLTDCAAALSQWSESPWKLIDVMARMIDAGSFNRFCGVGPEVALKGDRHISNTPKNKSDLLGETSLGLAADCLKLISSQDAASEPVQIYFDRHGGRRYYAGPIQEILDQSPVRVIAESSRQSVYETESDGRPVRMHFTVKGDRFVPVALSSLHAKYLREVAMASLNDYFRQKWDTGRSPGTDIERTSGNGNATRTGKQPSGENGGNPGFKPTAGYPSDADRFLESIDWIIRAEGITMDELVRCR